MANLVDPQGKVYSFEPKCFEDCKKDCKNIEINTNLSGQIKTIGEKEGKARFFCPPPGSEGMAGLKDTKRSFIDNVINVDVISLDKFIDDKNPKIRFY